jgi:two-component system OmpR family response regulator
MWIQRVDSGTAYAILLTSSSPFLSPERQMNLAPATSTDEGSLALPSEQGSLRVLCVDDNKDAADALAAVLEVLGCEARACYDGPSALNLFSEFYPNVCFLDLNMPGMNGLELAPRLRSCAGCRAILLVAVTALGSLEDRTKTAVTGFHFHLVKPVDGVRLADLINQFSTMLHRPNSKNQHSHEVVDDRQD